jgi:hypothetical protein
MKRIGFALALLVSTNASAIAQAKPVEVWECRDFSAANWKSILVRATVDSGREAGTIAVAGVSYSTTFHVAGFDRRWDFGPKTNPALYAFVIKPDGTGLYYDFETGEQQTRAAMVMNCRQRKP